MEGRVMPDCTLQGKSYRVVGRGRQEAGNGKKEGAKKWRGGWDAGEE